MFKYISNKIVESPAWKTVFGALIPILVGIFSATFIIEITNEDKINWFFFYKSISFYFLLLCSVFTFFYHRLIYMHEKQIDRFRDEDYCRAYMRIQCLPEAAEKYKMQIRNGDGGELAAAMKELERILK